MTNVEKSVYPGSGTVDDPFVVDFVEGDKDYARGYAGWRRWSYMLCYALGMAAGTFSVSSYTSGFEGMIKEFGTTAEILAIGQFLFLFGLGMGSLIWPAVGDFSSRRIMGAGTMTAFAAFSVGTAAANNMGTVLVSRFLAGLFAAGMQTLGPASLSNLFTPVHIAIPFTVAATSPFLGPSLGPLIGGYVVQYSGSWRNINYVSVGFAGVTAILAALVPELHGPIILRKRAKKLAKSTGMHYVSTHDHGVVRDVRSALKTHLVKPFVILVKEPIVLLWSLYLSFLYSVLQLFFTAYPIIYREERHWTQASAGLPYIALIVGYFAALPVTLLCAKPYLTRLRRDGYAAPEHRLYFAMIAAVLFPISLFWMGWTATPSVQFMSPVIAGSMFGFGQIGMTMSVFVYFADIYQVNVSAVFAALNFLRYTLGGVFPLFVRQMYQKLGVPWACSLIGFLLLAFLPVPFIFYRFGPAIRQRSRFVIAKPSTAPTAKKDIETGGGDPNLNIVGDPALDNESSRTVSADPEARIEKSKAEP